MLSIYNATYSPTSIARHLSSPLTGPNLPARDRNVGKHHEQISFSPYRCSYSVTENTVLSPLRQAPSRWCRPDFRERHGTKHKPPGCVIRCGYTGGHPESWYWGAHQPRRETPEKEKRTRGGGRGHGRDISSAALAFNGPCGSGTSLIGNIHTQATEGSWVRLHDQVYGYIILDAIPVAWANHKVET